MIRRKTSRRIATLLGMTTALLAATSGCSGCEDESGPPIPTTVKALYTQNCAVCHGDEGRGDGRAAYLVDPKPRDFRRGKFRLVSTDNSVPTAKDLATTIRRGMPGTPMPPWPSLSDAQVDQLAKYVLSLRRDEIIAKETKKGKSPAAAAKKADEKLAAGKVLEPKPPSGKLSSAGLKKDFDEQCADCHAEDGTGRDDPKWRTDEGFKIRSRNFKQGVFKGGRSDVELYRRIVAGMPGTPMPGFATLKPKQVWQMVRYIQSLSDPKAQKQAWVKAETIKVQHLGALPKDALDAGWKGVGAVKVALLPLRENLAAVASTSIRAATDGKTLAVRLEWSDPTHDMSSAQQQKFADGAALQFATQLRPPFFAMGTKAFPVRIWHWKASSQKQHLAALAKAAPADVYYSEKHGWMTANEVKDDESFLTGVVARNGNGSVKAAGAAKTVKAAPIRDAFELNATGFGTITPRAPGWQKLLVDAKWKDGIWYVLFSRPLNPKQEGDIQFLDREKPLSFGVAIWNGSIGDRDGQKSVTIWQKLELRK